MLCLRYLTPRPHSLRNLALRVSNVMFQGIDIKRMIYKYKMSPINRVGALFYILIYINSGLHSLNQGLESKNYILSQTEHARRCHPQGQPVNV